MSLGAMALGLLLESKLKEKEKRNQLKACLVKYLVGSSRSIRKRKNPVIEYFWIVQLTINFLCQQTIFKIFWGCWCNWV